MSQMPDSVYLHKDSKYCTVGHYSAYSENYILSENEFEESSLNDYVEYTPTYRLDEAVAQTKKDLIEKAEKWILDNIRDYADSIGEYPLMGMLEDFTKAMK